jgi:uncharacterized protein with HEPN domain
MRAMRNKVSHDYFEVDLEIVWNTVKNHLPQLKQQITRLLLEQQRTHELEQEREQDLSR